MASEQKLDDYITVTSGMSGWFAVHVWWNAEEGGFYEPYQTGLGRYATEQEAEIEAQSWAKTEGLPYVKRGNNNDLD